MRAASLRHPNGIWFPCTTLLHVVRSAQPGFIRLAASLLQRERKTMTKKDFELIAETIRIFSRRYLNETDAARLRRDFAAALTGTNSRFNADKFLTAAMEKAQ